MKKVGISIFWMVSATLLAVLFSFCWWLAGYGLDITDEAFYWAHIANPRDYYNWPSFFGAVWHPFYILVGEDLVALRRFIIVLTAVLSFALGFLFVKQFLPDVKKNIRLPFVFLLVIFGFCVFTYGVYTPSYNTLSLHGLMLASIALLLAEQYRNLGMVLLGVAGALVFLAKPSSASVLGVAASLYLIARYRKSSIINFAISGTSALIFLLNFAFFYSGGINEFIGSIQGGLEYYSIFDPTYGTNVVRTPFVLPPDVVTYFALLLMALLFLIKKNTFAGLAGVVLWIGAVIYKLGIYYYYFALVAYVILIFLFVVALWFFCVRKQVRDEVNFNRLIFALFLSSLPLAYSFGSNNTYLTHSQGAILFYMLAALTLIPTIFSNYEKVSILLAFEFSVLLIGVLICMGLYHLYRQPPFLDSQYESTQITPNTKIMLDSVTAQYTKDLRRIGNEQRFAHRVPILFDLTGGSPYAIFPSGLSSYGLAWTLGGYPGSEQGLQFIYNSISCKRLAGAWVLVEEKKGGRNISSQTLERFGVYLKDYKEVTDLVISGYSRNGKGVLVQTLYQPNITYAESLQKCQSSKR